MTFGALARTLTSWAISGSHCARRQKWERKMWIGRTLLALVLLAAIGLASFVAAQDGFTGNKVLPLIKVDLTGVANKQVIANIYEVPAGATVPRHFHHGDEFHLVLSGEWAAEVEGRPMHLMKAGDSQYVEREHWHGGKVVSDVPLRLLGLMIVDKDKPILELARD
jgi:quercetin dioxygenase-like cupin family protein